MKTNEITEGNRTLAEFMGLKPGYNSYTKKYNWGDGIFFMTNGDTIEEVMDAIVGYSKYHTSWDWLMPVVEKIESIVDNFGGQRFNFQIEQCFCCIIENHTSHDIVYMDSDTKMESVFTSCVEFAKWYKNQQKY